MKHGRTYVKRGPLLIRVVPPAGVNCATCLRGPYRSRVAAYPHALRCWASPLKRLGWHAACKTGYPVTRYGRSRIARFLSRFDTNPGP